MTSVPVLLHHPSGAASSGSPFPGERGTGNLRDPAADSARRTIGPSTGDTLTDCNCHMCAELEAMLSGQAARQAARQGGTAPEAPGISIHTVAGVAVDRLGPGRLRFLPAARPFSRS